MRIPFAHLHTRDEEVYVVVAGSGRAIIDGQLADLRPWSALRITAGHGHSVETDPDGLDLLVFRTHAAADRSEFAEAGWPA